MDTLVALIEDINVQDRGSGKRATLSHGGRHEDETQKGPKTVVECQRYAIRRHADQDLQTGMDGSSTVSQMRSVLSDRFTYGMPGSDYSQEKTAMFHDAGE